jgi:lipoprotein NlpD
MYPRYRSIVTGLFVAMLIGCASKTINAPIDSRTNQQSTVTKTASRPSSAADKSAQPDYYVVKGGDTLYSIAWNLGLNYRELASINDIRSPYTIYKDQRLLVKPATGQQPAMPAALQPQAAVTASAAPARLPAATPAAKPVPKPAASPQPAAAPGAVGKAAQAASQKSAAPAYDGKWVWPTRGRVLSQFQPSATGKKGIDIGGHADQPVNAAANGLVVYAGSGLVGYGRLIIVKHNESLLSAYGHNNKLLVNEGEHVSAGQMIAKMGSSGTNRNQLYFEIRKNGKPTDPMGYLPRQ